MPAIQYSAAVALPDLIPTGSVIRIIDFGKPVFLLFAQTGCDIYAVITITSGNRWQEPKAIRSALSPHAQDIVHLRRSVTREDFLAAFFPVTEHCNDVEDFEPTLTADYSFGFPATNSR